MLKITTKTGKPKGRPALYSENMRPVSVTLDPESKAKALAIGGGKLSAGIRIAVQAFSLPRPVPSVGAQGIQGAASPDAVQPEAAPLG